MLIRLDFSTGPRWTALLPGVEVFHDPVSSALMLEAGEASRRGSDDAELSLEERTVFITKFIARSVIREWRGILDDATGEPVAVTDATIDAVLDVFPIFRAFGERVIDARMRIEQEKKGFATLPDGSSDPVANTAETATGSAPPAPVH